MEPIIETYTMDWSEREQLRQERQLSRVKASLLERIPRQPMHTLPATLRDIEFHKKELQKDEEKLRRREDELAEFQPTIVKMEQQKPERYDKNPLRDKPSYHKYREYLEEKNRIESNLEFVKDNIEFNKNKIMELEEFIEEWDPGKSEERDKQMKDRYLQDQKDKRSANLFRMAARSNPSQESAKHQRSTENPLRRLTAQGPFYTKFDKLITGFADVPGALQRRRDSGGRKTRKKHK